MTAPAPLNWQLTTVGKIATVGSGGTPSRTIPAYWGGDVPWVTTSAINFNTISHANEMITEAGLKASAAKIFCEQTILMAMYGQGQTRGRVAMLGIPSATNQACAAITAGSEVLPKFLYFSLAKKYEEIRELGHGGNQKNLNSALIRQIPVLLPSLPEQRAIIDMMDDADKAVQKSEAILDAKITYKRAVAEDLLTGRRRFAEFRNSGAWIQIAIGSAYRIIQRYTNWDDAKAYQQIIVRRWGQGIGLRDELFGEEIKVKKLQIVKDGDFLISNIQAAYGAMHKITSDFDGHYVSSLYTALVPNGPQGHVEFLHQLAILNKLEPLIIASSNGFKAERIRLNFRPNSFLRQTILVPPTVDEQRWVADFLSLLDEEIQFLRRQRDILKKQKQELMQLLLTGQVRVPAFRDQAPSASTAAADGQEGGHDG